MLKESKDKDRDRLTVFGRTVTWEVFREKLKGYFDFLDKAVQKEQFGTGFLYRLLKYHQMHIDFKEKGQVERAIYRSRMSYDLKRNIEKRDTNDQVVNQDVLDQLYRLFDLRTQDTVLMDNLSISVQWALYRNRKGGWVCVPCRNEKTISLAHNKASEVVHPDLRTAEDRLGEDLLLLAEGELAQIGHQNLSISRTISSRMDTSRRVC